MSYILITESALNTVLTQRLFNEDGLPEAQEVKDLRTITLSDGIECFATTSDNESPYCALVSRAAIKTLEARTTYYFMDFWGRIARVVKSLKSPPIHLPRPWAEFHFQNRLSFFALPKTSGNYRWIADTDGGRQCVRFEQLTSGSSEIYLAEHCPAPWPEPWEEFKHWLHTLDSAANSNPQADALVEEVDLRVVGSGSVVQDRTYDVWLGHLSPEQKKVLNQPVLSSVRILGPAGSGKTLVLCMRAIKLARSPDTISQAKKILIVTHSWAMAERIDSALEALCGGSAPSTITVLPLLYVLQLHGGQIGRNVIDVVGDDSQGGRIAALGIIREILSGLGEKDKTPQSRSEWLVGALQSPSDSRSQADLALNIYDEFTGVLAAEGVAIDDGESIRRYLSATREDWMPPFPRVADRRFVLDIYRRFLSLLSDRGSITTDQFVSDTIRVLETFTWRMRRETEGYDFIFVDELQLFDSQERLALELLGRSGAGVPFTTAEDPSQGVFSALHRRQAAGGVNTSVYLEAVHRFDRQIFEFIKFIYQKFPLNTFPLRVDAKKFEEQGKPFAFRTASDEAAVALLAKRVTKSISRDLADKRDRTCVVTVGDIDALSVAAIENLQISVTQLRSYDDIEQLSYRKRSVVVAPWQFIGGTQFTNVIVLAAGVQKPNTAFGRLRELTALYLACSRATKSLEIICGAYVPPLIDEAIDAGLLAELNA